MSLSKLGLPGVRCGIVIANETITKAMANINGIISLAPASIGPAIAHHMIRSNELLPLSRDVIKPYYKKKSEYAVNLLQSLIPDPRFRIHKPEGAIFLWLWFEALPISTMLLYQRLKARGVLIVPGEYFFFGQEEEWGHAKQCLRMNYVQDEEDMEKGITIIAEEVINAYSES
jgi:valine--pyruvate aminotransferase